MTDNNGNSKSKADQAKKAAREAVDEVKAQVEEAAEAAKGPFDKFVDHEREALREASKAVEALLPEKFWTHGRKAAEEFATGVQVLADAVITELEKLSKQIEKEAEDEAADRPSTTGPAKIKVEVD
jgi:hypothetical protein